MGFITKNANILLLFLILISAVALVFSTVFFQSNFDEINKEYNKKMEALEKASHDLNVTLHALDIKATREKQLGEQYSVVQSEKEKIASQKEKLASQKATLESELTTVESELYSVRNDLAAKTTLVNDLTSDLSTCESELDYYTAKAKELEDDLDICKDDLLNCTS